MVRGVGFGFVTVISRIGTILAPYALLLGPVYSQLLFGSLAVLAGVLAATLPETLGKSLPESMLDGEERRLEICCQGQRAK